MIKDIISHNAKLKTHDSQNVYISGNLDASSIVALMDKYNGEPFSPHNIVILGYSFGFTHREELQKNLRALKDGNKTLTVNIDVRY